MNKKLRQFLKKVFTCYPRCPSDPAYKLAQEVFALNEQVRVIQEIMILKDIKEAKDA